MKNDFSGYVKDINERYTLEDKTEASLKLLNATYSGTGEIIAPNTLSSNIETITLSLEKDAGKVLFDLKNFSSNSIFESRSTYSSNVSLKELALTVKNLGKDVALDAKDLSVNLSSSTLGNRAEVNAKSAIEKLTLKSKEFDVNATGFNYDVTLSDIDKDSMEELRSLIANAKSKETSQLVQEIENATIDLLSKGLKLKVSDFSLKNVTLNKTQNLEGFGVKASLTLKEDSDFAKKAKQSPMSVAQDVDFNVALKISKPIFSLISRIVPMAYVIKRYAKEDANALLLDVSFVNAELKVNGKAL